MNKKIFDILLNSLVNDCKEAGTDTEIINSIKDDWQECLNEQLLSVADELLNLLKTDKQLIADLFELYITENELNIPGADDISKKL